ncbi:uncharacterized protein LOC122005891 [Zingiber officinale]|uniref:Uncharacterized protein n=1 Tax=Zingiber officinale TaxID=94328 RepID=A0A8J5I651_ZINOF|nr:uncharacterized protein LOC122005891 [Zingiber officinale]KAG6536563.1 hypothetical protein ZIOFF_001621 [Zingiber officinale]
MGNLLSCRVADVGMVVLSDGTVRELNGPTPVAELMLEHPREFVVDLHALTAAKGTNYVTPLPADHLLDPDKVYVMLPMAPRKAAVGLSATEARQVLAVAKQLAKPARSFLRVLGGQPKVVGPTKEKEKVVEEEAYAVGEVTEWCSDQETEVLMRQYSSRRWKPSLDTIVEKSLEKQKVPHWLF